MFRCSARLVRVSWRDHTGLIGSAGSKMMPAGARAERKAGLLQPFPLLQDESDRDVIVALALGEMLDLDVVLGEEIDMAFS